MARIRTQKPEYPTHPNILKLSLEARYAFLVLWPHCDDEGRIYDQPKKIEGLLFGEDDDVDIRGILQELSEKGRILRYEADGRKVIQVLGFTDHQRIDKPTKSQLPPPPEHLLPPSEKDDSKNPPRNIQEDSKNPPRGLQEGSRGEWNGKERNGKDLPEGTGSPASRAGGGVRKNKRPANENAVAPKLADDGSASRRDPDPEPLSEVEAKIAAVAAKSREMMRLPRRSADEIEALKRRGLDGDDEALRLWEAYAKEGSRG